MMFLRKFGASGLMLLFSLVALDAYIAIRTFAGAAMMAHANEAASGSGAEYFFDVGAGESELIVMPGGAKILVDAGPAGGNAAKAISESLPPGDRRIDIAIISCPTPDRMGGLPDVASEFNLGVVIHSGREPDAQGYNSWTAVSGDLERKGIPVMTLGAGDRIRFGGSEIRFLSPDAQFLKSADPAEASLVFSASFGVEAAAETKVPGVRADRPDGMRTVFMGCGNFGVEDGILALGAGAIKADILKIGDHAAVDTAGAAFLRAIDPSAIVIEAGGKNSSGLPSKHAVARMASSTSAFIFRTDMDGTSVMWPNREGGIDVMTKK